MKRLRVFFAIPFILLFLPLWRYLDMISFTWPHAGAFGMLFGFLTLLCFTFPLRLIRQQIHFAIVLVVPVALGLLASFFDPLSRMAAANTEFNHCGAMTYTSTFYPIRNFLSDAHTDDLEIRNQLCWTRKMLIRVLPKFSSEIEYTTYMKITREKLMRPQRKYRVSLPLITMIYGKIIHRWDEYNTRLMKNTMTASLLVDEMKFWTQEYTETVAARDYEWWDALHGRYIKWEYSLIEGNWQGLVNGIQLEP
jgi:hypothetical protein